MKTEEIVYITGKTPDGKELVGGLWTLWSQEGFPIEMFHLKCEQEGTLVDWIEALADADRRNNLHALLMQMEAFLPTHIILGIGAAYHFLSEKHSPQQILEKKRGIS